ncbi:MAG: hypothetical protein JW785_11455 [Acidimicrobiia bacterium]|nr:hypothetical protein [Acidimicrobiia bacterium]
MPKDPDGVARAGPTAAALLLVAAGVVGIVLLVRPAPLQSFPPDHGVGPADADWVHCAVETIERHPEPFAAQGGFEVERVGQGRLLVRSALLKTEVQPVEGSLSYWRFRGWHSVPLDCPVAQSGEA